MCCQSRCSRFVLLVVLLRTLSTPCTAAAASSAGNGRVQSGSVDVAPRALHLILMRPDAMKAVWYSPAGSAPATPVGHCYYGRSAAALELQGTGDSYTYSAGSFTGRLYEVSMVGLEATGAAYYYRCGTSNASLSEVRSFVLQPPHLAAAPAPTTIGLVADMGIDNSDDTMRSLGEAVDGGMRLLVHVGDISYADSHKPTSNNSHVWTEFMGRMANVTARVPYMTCPGNHEAEFDFAAYLNWLPMPGVAASKLANASAFWHSFDYAGVHFAMFSTEHDFSNGSAQHAWLAADLAAAAGNRAAVPWLVVVGHRPLYCSSVAEIKRCDDEAPEYRSYLEDLLNQHGADLYVNGHNHQYERSYPTYRQKPTQESYADPKAPVYVVNGAAGNVHPNDPTYLPAPMVPWRAAHGKGFETSWLRLTVVNATVLTVDSVLSSTSEVADSFTIRRSAAPS